MRYLLEFIKLLGFLLYVYAFTVVVLMFLAFDLVAKFLRGDKVKKIIH
jgi:hypothetical protein